MMATSAWNEDAVDTDPNDDCMLAVLACRAEHVMVAILTHAGPRSMLSLGKTCSKLRWLLFGQRWHDPQARGQISPVDRALALYLGGGIDRGNVDVGHFGLSITPGCKLWLRLPAIPADPSGWKPVLDLDAQAADIYQVSLRLVGLPFSEALEQASAIERIWPGLVGQGMRLGCARAVSCSILAHDHVLAWTLAARLASSERSKSPFASPGLLDGRDRYGLRNNIDSTWFHAVLVARISESLIDTCSPCHDWFIDVDPWLDPSQLLEAMMTTKTGPPPDRPRGLEAVVMLFDQLNWARTTGGGACRDQGQDRASWLLPATCRVLRETAPSESASHALAKAQSLVNPLGRLVSRVLCILSACKTAIASGHYESFEHIWRLVVSEGWLDNAAASRVVPSPSLDAMMWQLAREAISVLHSTISPLANKKSTLRHMIDAVNAIAGLAFHRPRGNLSALLAYRSMVALVAGSKLDMSRETMLWLLPAGSSSNNFVEEEEEETRDRIMARNAQLILDGVRLCGWTDPQKPVLPLFVKLVESHDLPVDVRPLMDWLEV
ncbi:hypothetical protein [Mollivirus kamchatka]|nr:hypothetical protein [Mollivirus kamchatka]